MTRLLPPPAPGSFYTEVDLRAYEEAVKNISAFYLSTPEEFEPRGYYGALLNSPPLAWAQSRASMVGRETGESATGYSHADREWIDQVVSEHWDFYGVLATNTLDGVAVGIRLEAIEALWQDREDDLTDDERLLTTYIRQVVDGGVTDEIYERMEERMGTRGLVEYTVFIGHLTIVFRAFQAMDIPSKIRTRAEFNDLLRGIRDGTVKLPRPEDAVRMAPKKRS
jgi:hypothetical protein